MRDLGTLGGRESRAMAINSEGTVAGAATNRSKYFHATVWSASGDILDLGALGGGHSYAYGLNDAGLVVGSSYDAQGRSRAFVWSGGVLYDLNDLVTNAAGWSLTAAYGINQSGQIVGSGFFNGQSSAFRLDPSALSVSLHKAVDTQRSSLDFTSEAPNPVPEPRNLSLVGLSAILAWQWRRRTLCSHVLNERSK
jgi:probable HAF family extracellular repeat protein